MIKFLWIVVIFSSILNASYKDGKKVFNNKCVTCHIEYVALPLLINNFKNHKNKLLNLKAAPFNRLAYNILNGKNAIGHMDDDLDMRKEAIKEYLKDYLLYPDTKKSVMSKRSRDHFIKKIPLKNITDEDYKNLVDFIVDFKTNHNFTVKKDESEIDENVILHNAKKNNKYIIVEATSKDCHYCKKMKDKVLKLKDVKDAINKNYIFVEANIDKTNLPFDLEKDFLKMTPTFFFLNENGKIIKQYPGAWNKKDFLELLREHKKSSNEII